MTIAEPRTLGIGAGIVIAAASAVSVWLYTRWLERRNRPINRLRRGARAVASRISEHVPDTSDLPEGTAPMGGAATAIALTGLMLVRALRHDDSAEREEEAERERRSRRRRAIDDFREATRRQADRLPPRDVVREMLAHELQDLLESSRKRADRLPALDEVRRAMLDKLPSDVPSADEVISAAREQPKQTGIGVGGVAAIGAAAFVIWRLLRGRGGRSQNWYVETGTPR
jgi:hypothetical protein